ncbi:MAG: TonB-dependent receptor [Bacteroidales bacterium]|nr:TonB-dependent receptor [Bacteroidales bacterium]MBP5521400.1 TonB-dependent receptor [Bacteroidales bacterium]
MTLSPTRILTVLASLALSITMSAQNVSVSGQVLDASTGEPIIGAGVLISTGGGTVTDFDGNYTVSAPQGSVLTFSSLGYTEHKETVDGRTSINVSLQPDNQLLDEVVVLGYTTQKKAELSSAVVSMSGEKLRDVATPDVGNMLQGKVAGVVVMNGTGQPGASADIRIRGTGSITAGAGPLYVVDGVAGGSFNPNDIETLTVLKDASATALYGAAASGGVIVVTTKSGSGDKTNVEFKASAGIKRALTGRFKPMNSKELYNYTKGMYSKTFFSLKYPETLLEQDFDWVGNSFKTGVVQNYYASVSGKAGKVSYYASLDHYNEKGTLINTNFRKNAARLNLSAPITDRFTIHARINYAKTYDQSESSWRTLEYSYYAMPWDIPYVMDENGKYTDEPLYVTGTTRPDNGGVWWTQNPSNILHSERYNYSKGHGEDITGDLQLVWNVTDWLTLTSTNRYDSSNSYYEYYVDPRTYDAAATHGSLENSDGEWNGWGTTDLAKFHKTFGDHDVNAIVGWEYGEGYSRSMGATGINFPIGQRSLSNAIMNSISGSDAQSRSWAWLAQAQYSYLGKYIATASIRYDESYKFGPLNRGGYFPGASAAWIISKEDFLQGNSFLTFLKLRGGYGKTGNDNIPAFTYQDTFSLSGQYNKVKTAILERMANPSLGWEEAYMASLGVDAEIANNWNVTVDLYHTINSKILLESPMSPSTGFFAVMDNVGKVRNMGVELAADGNIIHNKNFTWSFGFNVGLNQNRVLELPEHQDIVMNRGDVNQIIREGQDIYSWYMPKWAGVDPQTGLPQFEQVTYKTNDQGEVLRDKNNNPIVDQVTIVNNINQATQQIVGVASPIFSGGFNTGATWKGITLSVNGNFVVGNQIYNKNREQMDADGAYTGLNQMSINNGLGWKRWKKEGDKATHPGLVAARSDGSNGTSSRYLEDGSFFRLRNVTLSYNLPESILKNIKMEGARVYVSGDNLFTASRFSGMDPEIRLDGDTYHHAGLYSSNYPVPLSVVLGIDIKF